MVSKLGSWVRNSSLPNITWNGVKAKWGTPKKTIKINNCSFFARLLMDKFGLLNSFGTGNPAKGEKKLQTKIEFVIEGRRQATKRMKRERERETEDLWQGKKLKRLFLNCKI